MNDKTVYDFAGDAAKAVSNIGKHGVTFDDAATIFTDAFALSAFDVDHSQSEDR